MNARAARSDLTGPYAVSACGAHSFATDLPGRRALVDGALTGAQVRFLAGNPAAARCCVERSWLTADWLDRLMTACGAEPEGGIH